MHTPPDRQKMWSTFDLKQLLINLFILLPFRAVLGPVSSWPCWIFVLLLSFRVATFSKIRISYSPAINLLIIHSFFIVTVSAVVNCALPDTRRRSCHAVDDMRILAKYVRVTVAIYIRLCVTVIEIPWIKRTSLSLCQPNGHPVCNETILSELTIAALVKSIR